MKKGYFRCALCQKVTRNIDGSMVYYDRNTDVAICSVHLIKPKKFKSD